MAIALVATIGAGARPRSIDRARRWPCWSSPMVIGAAIGLWRAPGRRDDRHARADRAAALLRRPGRGAGRLERLPARRSATPAPSRARPETCSASTTPRCSSASSSARSPSPARSWPSSSCRPGSSPAPLMLPGKNVAQPRRARRLRRADRLVRDRPAPRAADRGHRAGAGRSAGTWSPRSAAATCRSWCRCSTATPAGPRPRRASCSTTTC